MLVVTRPMKDCLHPPQFIVALMAKSLHVAGWTCDVSIQCQMPLVTFDRSLMWRDFKDETKKNTSSKMTLLVTLNDCWPTVINSAALDKHVMESL